jgi:hypothetical protein
VPHLRPDVHAGPQGSELLPDVVPGAQVSDSHQGPRDRFGNYSRSPTAARAFLGSRYSRTRITLPPLNSTIQAIADSVIAPLSLPRPRR